MKEHAPFFKSPFKPSGNVGTHHNNQNQMDSFIVPFDLDDLLGPIQQPSTTVHIIKSDLAASESFDTVSTEENMSSSDDFYDSEVLDLDLFDFF
jgi:hypothetical protein